MDDLEIVILSEVSHKEKDKYCPIFDWVIYFPGIELQELLVYFGD